MYYRELIYDYCKNNIDDLKKFDVTDNKNNLEDELFLMQKIYKMMVYIHEI